MAPASLAEQNEPMRQAAPYPEILADLVARLSEVANV